MYDTSMMGSGIRAEIEYWRDSFDTDSAELRPDAFYLLPLKMSAMLAPLRKAERLHIFRWWMGLTAGSSEAYHLSRARKTWRTLMWPLLLDGDPVEESKVENALIKQLCGEETRREHAVFALWLLSADPNLCYQWTPFCIRWATRVLQSLALGYGASPFDVGVDDTDAALRMWPSRLRPHSRAAEWSALVLCEAIKPLFALRLLPYLPAARHVSTNPHLLRYPVYIQALFSAVNGSLKRLSHSAQQTPLPFDSQFVWDIGSSLEKARELGTVRQETLRSELRPANSIAPSLAGATLFAALRGSDTESAAESLSLTLSQSQKVRGRTPVTASNFAMRLQEILSSTAAYEQSVLWRRAAALAIRWVPDPRAAYRLAELALRDESVNVRLSSVSSLRMRAETEAVPLLREALWHAQGKGWKPSEATQEMLHTYARLQPELSVNMCFQLAQRFTNYEEIRGRALTIEAVLRKRAGEPFASIVCDLLKRTAHNEAAINIASMIAASAGLPKSIWEIPAEQNALLRHPLRAPLWYGTSDL